LEVGLLSFLRLKKPVVDPDPLITMINQTQAVIRFQPDGTIITANDNFLKALEYTLPEIAGKHHSMFVDPAYAQSDEYKKFWHRLALGHPFTDQYQRRCKSGRTIWIQATYAGVADSDGRITGVIKVATDVTPRNTAMSEIAIGLRALSEGDLTYRLPRFSLPDLARIGEMYNMAIGQLADILQQVARVAQQVQLTSQGMDGTPSELSTRTTAQAATLEQTAASLEELTATVKSSAQSVRDADRLAAETAEIARNSDAVVTRAIDAMAQIKSSSNEISQIIAVIDDIAFQTNLLALNAGVEAARAGDAGRGFAVVASEVRGLAHRAQGAAGEIKSLISRSAGHVSLGVDLVNETGEELKNIVHSIGTISDTMGAIGEAARQQSIALDEINSGVGHLDTVTQKNAGMVDQMAQVNTALIANVTDLVGQVSRFGAGDAGKPPLRRAG